MANGDQGARTRLTPKRKAAFIEALAEMGNVLYACRKIDCSRTTAYHHREKDQAFADAWERAIEESSDKLEQEAWRRAHDGVEEVFIDKEGNEHSKRRYSDVLLIFLLKGMRPHKYRERHELSGDRNNPLVVENNKAQAIEIAFVEPGEREDDHADD